MIRIVPVCSTTNSRPDPSPALRDQQRASTGRWRSGSGPGGSATARWRRRRRTGSPGRSARWPTGRRRHSGRGPTSTDRTRRPPNTARTRARGAATLADVDLLELPTGSRVGQQGARRCPSPICPWPSCARTRRRSPFPTTWIGSGPTTLADARAHDLAATFEPVDNHLSVISTLDVTYAGFGGSPVRAWLHLPADRPGPLPAVVEYLGYGGGRGLAHERVLWAAAGYAHLVMDTRGQGSTWAVGDTPDPDAAGAPFHPGFMTQGILDPATYYYRRVFVDAVRAVEAVRAHHLVDPARVAVTGGSQGGGISIAVAALVPGHRRGHAGRAVPERLPTGDHVRRQRPVRRDRALPQGPSRPCRAGPRDPVVFRRGDPRTPGVGARHSSRSA